MGCVFFKRDNAEKSSIVDSAPSQATLKGIEAKQRGGASLS
jgi:hypothetical protein